ncbi:hypothetical protein D3C87_1271250 [compost metagenome]|jgi:hypothetical protein
MTDTLGFTKFNAELWVTHDPLASKLLGQDYWRVMKSFRYYIGTKGSNRWVEVPAGYLTDGASVPRAFWSIIPPWGSYGQAAVVHDILCEYLTIVEDGLPKRITRKEADEILLEAMHVLEVPELTAHTIYNAVKLYQITFHVTEPSNDPKKRAVEAQWAQEQILA